MTWLKQKQARDQRRKRRQKHAHAFLFTVEGQVAYLLAADIVAGRCFRSVDSALDLLYLSA